LCGRRCSGHQGGKECSGTGGDESALVHGEILEGEVI
jgi:hypothetical protein